MWQLGKTRLRFSDINGENNCFRVLVKQQRDTVSDVSYLKHGDRHLLGPVAIGQGVMVLN